VQKSGFVGTNALIRFSYMHCRRSWTYFGPLMIMALSMLLDGLVISCFLLCQCQLYLMLPHPRLCLLGQIKGTPIRILVDSRTFISEALAGQLIDIQPVQCQFRVQVVDDNILPCVSLLPQASWSVDGCSFQSYLKILPASTYDMILGLDWLEQFNPMKIHWQQKLSDPGSRDCAHDID
jgi:hypothetical protein